MPVSFVFPIFFFFNSEKKLDCTPSSPRTVLPAPELGLGVWSPSTETACAVMSGVCKINVLNASHSAT